MFLASCGSVNEPQYVKVVNPVSGLGNGDIALILETGVKSYIVDKIGDNRFNPVLVPFANVEVIQLDQ